MAEFARTFDEYVAWMALNAPHATVLDWWRRLEIELAQVAIEKGTSRHPAFRFDALLRADAEFGPAFVDRVVKLRSKRNETAHESSHVNDVEAIAYAREVFELIGVLGRRAAARSVPHAT